MHALPPVTPEQIAREFREMRCTGSAMEALSPGPLRRVLEAAARRRVKHEESRPRAIAHDGRRRASGDFE
ncbi:hypothetical protein [Paraburkholderia pallida]|uniref:Uncharacterized protein n=1 Tax=Paraburkholderia pallida TaxID=2547399 RepID=A0A4P7CY19_9BURK|nr:hypothetical protein [Paraburkholderia pallida]QBQ99219.1 hypothetical protein E1956_18615 [Paraburkholderia pallida]